MPGIFIKSTFVPYQNTDRQNWDFKITANKLQELRVVPVSQRAEDSGSTGKLCGLQPDQSPCLPATAMEDAGQISYTLLHSSKKPRFRKSGFPYPAHGFAVLYD